MEEQHQDSFSYAIPRSMRFFVAVSVVLAALLLFHLYIQCWLFLRHRRRFQQRNVTGDISSGRHHRRSTAVQEITSVGLDRSVIMSLPTFLYVAKNQEAPLECAVCISEFEDKEAGRILPECNHCFHVDCIDMWLQSHCDCPLCRARVKGQPGLNRVESGENERVVPTTGSGVVLGPAQSEGLVMGLSSSARTLDAGPMEQHRNKTEEDSDPDPDTDGSLGPDLELGSNYGAVHISNGVTN